jgi:hypothetical protein
MAKLFLEIETDTEIRYDDDFTALLKIIHINK